MKPLLIVLASFFLLVVSLGYVNSADLRQYDAAIARETTVKQWLQSKLDETTVNIARLRDARDLAATQTTGGPEKKGKVKK